MSPADRPTVVSRRNLVRALLGRNIPPSGEEARQTQADPHAAGDAAFIAGDFAGAVAAYRASVRGDLSNVAVRTRLGQALFLTGQFIQARVEFEHALRLTDGQDPMSASRLAATGSSLVARDLALSRSPVAQACQSSLKKVCPATTTFSRSSARACSASRRSTVSAG